jgi:site-specific DNA recombinase
MRAVVYARDSSDQQSAASIEDQIEVCRRYIAGQRWQFVRTYEDRALSGGSAARPGFQALLADAERGLFEVVVCEAVDRLGRKLADVAALHDRLEFRRIQLHAVNMGVVTTMQVGLLGTMAQLYLADLKEKTRRRPGRPCALNEGQQAALKALILRGPSSTATAVSPGGCGLT